MVGKVSGEISLSVIHLETNLLRFAVLDVVFSLDSVIAANEIDPNHFHYLKYTRKK